MDIDAIPFGVNFQTYMTQVLSTSDAVIAMIGPNWLGKRFLLKPRLFDQGDYVRMEIRTALCNNIPVIPLLLDGTKMPLSGHLPDDLRGLSDLNAAELSLGRDFDQHANRLKQSIDALLACGSVQVDPKVEPVPTTHTGSFEPKADVIVRNIANYDFDVYVSYIRSDTMFQEEWYSKIVIDLSHALAKQLGRRVVFSNWGDGPQAGELRSNISNLVERSALLLACLSPSYLQSEWCRAELQVFVESHRNALEAGQVFVIERAPASRNIEPNVFRKLAKYRFHKVNETGDLMRFASPRNLIEQREYFEIINALASDMAKHLRKADEDFTEF
jgi:hypothetical protein